MPIQCPRCGAPMMIEEEEFVCGCCNIKLDCRFFPVRPKDRSYPGYLYAEGDGPENYEV